VIKDDRFDIDYDNNYRHKNRRVLSRSQREEANRRERHRMNTVNHFLINSQI
jgi:hypothetical protein